MKGYVCVNIDDNFKNKLEEFYKELLFWTNKPKEELIEFTIKKKLFCTEWDYKLTIPEDMQKYVYVYVLDKDHYYKEILPAAQHLEDIRNLLLTSNTVHLGEVLIREYNYLVYKFKGE